MGHCISAVILKGDFDSEVANSYDLHGIELSSDLTMFLLDHYYTAFWGKMLDISGELPVNQPKSIVFPNDLVVADLMTKITNQAKPLYALIQTDYFGGVGEQWADVYQGNCLVRDKTTQINSALSFLGVKGQNGMDEFDTVGLGNYRSMPDDLDKYVDLVDQIGA